MQFKNFSVKIFMNDREQLINVESSGLKPDWFGKVSLSLIKRLIISLNINLSKPISQIVSNDIER